MSVPFLTIIFLIHDNPAAWAQTPEHRLELGAQLSGIRFSGLEESGLGGGVRAGWRVQTWLAVEGEFNRIPENPDGDFGQTLLVSGVRLGLPLPSLEVAAKLRPGGVHFGGRVFQAFNPQVSWKPTMDVGVTRPGVFVPAEVRENLIEEGMQVCRCRSTSRSRS